MTIKHTYSIAIKLLSGMKYIFIKDICIYTSKQIMIKYTKLFKRNEHCERPDRCAPKPRNFFAYPCLDNVKMYKYATFYQNVPCGSRVMNISLKDFNRLDRCSAMPHYQFAYQWLDNVRIYWYAKLDPYIPCGLRVMSILLTYHDRPH